jgi:hypothetical protein
MQTHRIDKHTRHHIVYLTQLKQVADDRDLGEDWPGEQLRKQLEARAERLFLWVDTVCDYPLNLTDPTWELSKLLSASDGAVTSAEAKMDKLYATILDACNARPSPDVRRTPCATACLP